MPVSLAYALVDWCISLFTLVLIFRGEYEVVFDKSFLESCSTAQYL